MQISIAEKLISVVNSFNDLNRAVIRLFMELFAILEVEETKQLCLSSHAA